MASEHDIDSARLRRTLIIETLQQAWGDGVILGVALVIEVMTPEYKREFVKITTDPSGEILSWAHERSYVCVMDECDEFDALDGDDD